jgi:excisionase family DNA binding protein
MISSNLRPEKYPLIVQVVQDHLMIYSPDFDYRVMEAWRPGDVGQTEMLLLKVRRELQNRMLQIQGRGTPLPSPKRISELTRVPEGDLLTTREVARLLRVSDETVRRLASSGQLAFHTTPGGHRRFKRSHVEHYLSASPPRPLHFEGRA